MIKDRMKFSISKGKGKKSHAIGIDFGTTNSCVGVWQHGRVEIITDEKGNQTTPSCVSFTNNKQLTGHAAKNQIRLNADNTIYGAKKLIGRGFKDETVQRDKKLWPFKVVSGPGITTGKKKKAMIAVTHKGKKKVFAPEEISAMVLKKMKQTAEAYLGSKVKDAVITVPAHFNHSQREATKEAGIIAGLNVTRIIHEPVAAVVTYIFNDKKHNPREDPENILVFDFGGATLDVSLITIDKDFYDLKAAVTDDCLGGDSFDDALADYFVGEFEKKHGKDIRQDPKALARLRTACERVKCVLSWEVETTIEIDCLYDSIDFSSQVTRALLEKLNEDLFKKCIQCVNKCLMKAAMCTKNVHTVVLVGGSSRIPKVEQMLQDFFKESYTYIGLNPEVAVAYGAAIISNMITADRSNAEGVESELTDFTSLPLGVEVHGGDMSVVAPKHTQLPTKRAKVYTTVHDNQTVVRFPVYEGESSIANLNTYLNQFELADVPKAPKGKPKFDLYFEINKAGILNVSAVGRETNNKEQIVVSNYSLTSLRIDLTRMIHEASVNKFTYESPQKELIDHNQNFKEFASTILRRVHKKLMYIAHVTCFDIGD